MSQERPWYQSGWVALAIVLLLVTFGPTAYQQYRFSQLAQITPQLAGRIEEPLIGPPIFHVTAWHQNAGDLKNGILSVGAKGDLVADPENSTKVHSFETWSPNKENAISWAFPLVEFDASKEIEVVVFLKSKISRVYFAVAKWKDREWTDISEHKQ
jgi:hypothetical protein